MSTYTFYIPLISHILKKNSINITNMIIRKIAVIYFALLATFTLFIILTFTIPTSGIKDNLIKSVEQINEEGLWYKPMGIYLFQIDNMTDCIMMDINACADSENPVRSAMITNYALPNEDNSTPAYENITGKTLDILINGQKSLITSTTMQDIGMAIRLYCDLFSFFSITTRYVY